MKCFRLSFYVIVISVVLSFVSFVNAAPKFDKTKMVRCSLKKPLGLSLEEVSENKAKGVMITEVNEGGSAKAAGLTTSLKGKYLVSVNNVDMRSKTFDEVIDMIGSASEPIAIECIAPDDVFKGPATLTVSTEDGKQTTINTIKGLMLRDVLLSSGIDVYTNTAKLTNCNGNLQCATCVVDVTQDLDFEPRSDIEAKRLKKYATSCRLSCNTVIEGDCSVTVRPPTIA